MDHPLQDHPESVRDSSHCVPAPEISLGQWFVFALAFLVSMGWGVLVALGGEALPPPKADGSRQAVSGGTQDLAPPLWAVRVAYLHAEGIRLNGPRGVFVEPESGEIYVADTANNLVAVFDRQAVPLFSFGFNREFAEPQKAVVDPRGRLYVLGGIPPVVMIFSFRGEYIRDFPFGEGFKGMPAQVTAMAADRSGNLYFGDSGNGEVLVFGPDHRLTSRFEVHQGKDRSRISGIAIAETGEIYVVDVQATPAVRVYSPDGKFLRGWGEHATGPQNFSYPSGIALAGGRVIVVDSIRHSIISFTSSGTYLRRDGGYGLTPGGLAYPTDIATDAKGRVYVVDRVGNRLQVLEPGPPPQAESNRESNGAIRRGKEVNRVRAEVKEVIRGMQAN
jgi:DNA-binding beta-propeller fold protein YncE